MCKRKTPISKNKIGLLETRERKTNIFIFGLKTTREAISSQFICEKFKQLLDMDVTVSDFNDLYPLGKSATSPIKVELLAHQTKHTVLQNCPKLKETSISITQDLNPKQ
ncbi:hypothetical protein NQ314_000810 [Rhamnusium bicolor]|uniref:Uncharacterized protein n=1 Tax=Rhamnusium bicolor TaxID=1586634 RepID=A0AAV8ZTH4_9CUCU|nr:hypothetical protein NQ314_000810 [Rhamnusium bicolor]